jgi:hypothetical protein
MREKFKLGGNMSYNYKKILFFLIFSLFFFGRIFSQGTNDWFRNVPIINSGKPIDFSSLVDTASKSTEIVCIGIVNIDLTNDSTERVDLNRKKDFLSCLPNFDLNKFRVKCYNYTGHNEVDLHVKWGEENVKKNDAGKRSSFYIITSNPDVISRLENNTDLRRGLSLFVFDSINTDFEKVHIYSSMEIEKNRVVGDFCWKLNQNFTYFSNFDLSMPKEENSDSLFRKVRINLKANVGVNGRDQFSQNIQTSFGFEFIKGNSCNVFINLGIQQTKDIWKNGFSESRVNSVSQTNQEFDELLITTSNIREDYILSNTSAFFGLDSKWSLKEGFSYWGLYGNLSFPITSDLGFENTNGTFEYVGISNSIQEPLTNIPDLGLFSNVSYVGYRNKLVGKLSPFGDGGLLFGWSLGRKAPIDLNVSIGYATPKSFKLEKINTAVSNSFGEYNSLSSVNNSKISVPGYLNFGIGFRKYLN